MERKKNTSRSKVKKIQKPYQLFDNPFIYYNSMLEDIKNARKYIYLETYRIGNDTMGGRFRDALTKKAKQGVNVKILLDSWGSTTISRSFFSELITYGGEVRFFEKIKINFDFFTRSHRRNHRKLLIIDDEISYLGSSNITDYNLSWRELVIRIHGYIALSFKKIFRQDFRIYNKYVYDKVRYSKPIKHEDLEIVRDVPSIRLKRINKKYIQLIKKAKKQILIETPYFLPGFLLRKAISDAAKQGVDVKVIIPKHSDVGLVDILRNKYLGSLYKNGVKILYFMPHNLHSKAMLIDDRYFSIGSANFDYRTFRYMHEIILVGSDPRVIIQLNDHISESMQNCEEFDYEGWLRRPLINRFFEWILLPFRHLL